MQLFSTDHVTFIMDNIIWNKNCLPLFDISPIYDDAKRLEL